MLSFYDRLWCCCSLPSNDNDLYHQHLDSCICRNWKIEITNFESFWKNTPKQRVHIRKKIEEKTSNQSNESNQKYSTFERMAILGFQEGGPNEAPGFLVSSLLNHLLYWHIVFFNHGPYMESLPSLAKNAVFLWIWFEKHVIPIQNLG